jgi:YVTN family beta-propeller protein
VPDSADIQATIPVSVRPRRIAITPDGSRAYVTLDDFGPGTSELSGVAMIDTATNAVVTTIAVGARPSAVLCSPDGKHVYVPNWAKDAEGRPGVLSVIATDTNTVVATVEVSARAAIPSGAAVTPDGRDVYVACEKEPFAPDSTPGTVAVVDTATNTVRATIPGSQRPDSVTITPAGDVVYVLDHDGEPQLIETATHASTFDFVGSATTGSLAFTPDGLRLYVVGDDSDFVDVVDLTTKTVVGAVDVSGGHCTGALVTSDGSRLCISQRPGKAPRRKLYVVDTATNLAIGSPVDWTGSADGLAVSPDGGTAYVSDRPSSAVRVIRI